MHTHFLAPIGGSELCAHGVARSPLRVWVRH